MPMKSKKRLENREKVLQPGPVAHNHPRHNHYVQYNRKTKKVKGFVD